MESELISEEQDYQNIEPVPLIPELEKATCPDTSHVIREEFQEILGRDTFPIPIAEHLEVFHTEQLELKYCGREILSSYNDLKKKDYEMTRAELLVMESQAKFLNSKEEIAKFFLDPIYPDIDPEIIEKYYLLKAEDVFPHITKRILNNKMRPKEFIYTHPCIQSVKDKATYRRITCPERPNLTTQQILDSQVNENILLYEKQRKHQLETREDYSDKTVFEVQPRHIVFRNFTTNVVYEKRLHLINITAHSQRLLQPILKKDSKFCIKDAKVGAKIAPGMSVNFIVCFQTDIIQNYSDELIFHVVASQPIFVQLSTYRESPILKGLVYYNDFFSENITSSTVKNTVHNYTVDCGTVLYGCNTEVNFIIQNLGGKARFFFVAETEWVNRELTFITENFKLILKDFTIYPAFFELKKDEICEIKFEFFPTEEGLLLDKVFLLSDTNSIEEIDIIADCIYYEPDFLDFHIPECPFAPFKSQEEIKNILNMGAIYTNQMVIGKFSMLNKSMLQIPYEWRIEQVSKGKDYYCVQKNWVKIYPDSGVISPLLEENFEVRVKMNCKKLGLYKFILSIFAIDIPESCLTDGLIYTFGEEYRSKDLIQKLLTIRAGIIEVQIHHIPLSVFIYPEELIFPKLTYQIESCMSDIKIVNDGFCCLSFKWIKKPMNKNFKIKMKPICFNLKARESISCKITVLPKSYEDIYETFTLSINHGYLKKELRIQAQVEKPRMRVSKSFINFGLVKKQANINAVFVIQNLSQTALFWEVLEYQYDFNYNRFIEVNTSSLSSNCGQLCHQKSLCEITYALDTSVPKKFFSILIFFTIYNYQRYESTHVFLIGHIQEPIVKILSALDSSQIFKIEEIYYINETITKTFSLYNESIVEANYFWTAPFGVHKNHIKYSFDCNNGKICPYSRKNVEVTLFFKKAGIIYDYYIPCYIETLNDPIILQFLCVIKNPQVIFHIPMNNDIVEVVWPPDIDIEYVADEMDDIISPYAIYKNLSLEHLKQPETLEVSQSIEKEKSTTLIVLNDDFDTNWNGIPNDIFSYLKNMQMITEEASCHESVGTLSTPISTHTLKSTIPLYSIFASDTSICEYVIEFLDLKCREVYSKTVQIINPMDLPLNFSISLKNFTPKELKQARLDKIFINLNWKPDDTHSLQLTDHGIVVLIQPISSTLHNKSTTIVTISIYAETWGYYLEEISIKIEQIPMFYLNLVIQVVGMPIEFPLMVKTEHTLRFSSIQKCTSLQTRQISFYNNSNIPCHIVWHAFAKNIADHCKGPINILYDIFGFEDDTDESVNCSLKIIKYLGKEITMKYEIFKVRPQEICVHPKETKQITVTFDPTYFEKTDKHLIIEGGIVGHVYLEKKYRHGFNFVARNPDQELPHIKIDIKTSIRHPTLDLECIRGNANIKIHINDILNDNNNKKNIRLIFQNNSKTNIVVRMNIIEPFEVLKLTSVFGEKMVEQEHMEKTVVFYNGCLEVIIVCEIMEPYLMNLADVLYQKVNHYLKDVEILSDNKMKITRYLKIYQECEYSQQIPITVTLIFPLITVSTNILNFEQVNLGSEKKMTFKLLNETATKTWFNIIFKKDDVPEFTVEPSEGYLEPLSFYKKSLYLTVTFKPKDNKLYQEIILIKTKLEQYQHPISLIGFGTFNEKFFCKEAYEYKCIS